MALAERAAEAAAVNCMVQAGTEVRAAAAAGEDMENQAKEEPEAWGAQEAMGPVLVKDLAASATKDMMLLQGVLLLVAVELVQAGTEVQEMQVQQVKVALVLPAKAVTGFV